MKVRSVIFHFYKREGILPDLIRWFGGGEWNHVSVEVNGWTYEAIGGRLKRSNGVLASPSPKTQHDGDYEPTKIESIAVECTRSDELEAETYLKSKVGKPYGYIDILAFVFRWVRGRANSYYCSELAASALEIVRGKVYDLKYSPSAVYEMVK